MSDLTKYPKLIQLEDYDGIVGIFVYVQEDYGTTGLCCRIDRTTPDTKINIGDWNGNKWTPSDKLMQAFMNSCLPMLLQLTAAVKLKSAEFYFTMVGSEFMLADILIGPDKFASPGMVEELFGKVFRIPNTIDKTTLTPESLAAIKQGVGKFAGNLVIKPNRYRTVRVDNATLPLYIRVAR